MRNARQREASCAGLAMLVDVVCLWHRGTKLTTEEIRAAPKVRGDLMVTTDRVRNGNGGKSNYVRASLTPQDGREDLLPPLVEVMVKTVQASELLIIGAEVHIPKPQPGVSFQCRQTWWCRLVTTSSGA